MVGYPSTLEVDVASERAPLLASPGRRSREAPSRRCPHAGQHVSCSAPRPIRMACTLRARSAGERSGDHAVARIRAATGGLDRRDASGTGRCGRARPVSRNVDDSNGDELWTEQSGTVGDDRLLGGGGLPYDVGWIVGSTDGAFPGYQNAGGEDVLLALVHSGDWKDARASELLTRALVAAQTYYGANGESYAGLRGLHGRAGNGRGARHHRRGLRLVATPTRSCRAACS
jgi:hypothetical protein